MLASMILNEMCSCRSRVEKLNREFGGSGGCKFDRARTEMVYEVMFVTIT